MKTRALIFILLGLSIINIDAVVHYGTEVLFNKIAMNFLYSDGNCTYNKKVIPKVIHFIWMGSKLPLIYNFCIQSWQRCHPGWELIIWDDEKLKTLDIRSGVLIDSLSSYAAKTDVLRLEILYKFGGIYADIDYFCLSPFDKYVEKSKLFFGDMFGDCIGNSIIGSSQGNEFIGYLIDQLNNSDKSKYLNMSPDQIIANTGPVFINNCFYDYYTKNDNYDGVIVFPVSYLYPFPGDQRNDFWSYKLSISDIIKKYTHQQTLAIHLWSVSWLTPRIDNLADLNSLSEALAAAGKDFFGLTSINSVTGKTALHVLAEKGDEVNLRYLILAGADINARDYYNKTALIYATDLHHQRCVSVLNADYNEYPLIKAVQLGQREVSESLLRHGYNVNVCDKDGFSALYYASLNRDFDIGRLLILNGADLGKIANDVEFMNQIMN
jgi:hypothetical protein